MEGVSGSEKPVIEMERETDGTYAMKAEALVADIAGYEDMSSVEKVDALVSLMETLAEDNANRHVVEVLAKRARALELYQEIEAQQEELAQLGRSVDVHV